MNSNNLVLKCYAEQEDGVWVAVCLDFNLAAQADTLPEAKEKLEAMILSYVREALTIDLDYADQLLTRRAPLSAWLRYYLIKVCNLFHNHKHAIFSEIMPMRPA